MEIKHGAIRERLDVIRYKGEYNEVQDTLDVLVEANNSLKAYIRIWEEEVRSLNLSTQ